LDIRGLLHFVLQKLDASAGFVDGQLAGLFVCQLYQLIDPGRGLLPIPPLYRHVNQPGLPVVDDRYHPLQPIVDRDVLGRWRLVRLPTTLLRIPAIRKQHGHQTLPMDELAGEHAGGQQSDGFSSLVVTAAGDPDDGSQRPARPAAEQSAKPRLRVLRDRYDSLGRVHGCDDLCSHADQNRDCGRDSEDEPASCRDRTAHAAEVDETVVRRRGGHDDDPLGFF
jgi:hypothetical protein